MDENSKWRRFLGGFLDRRDMHAFLFSVCSSGFLDLGLASRSEDKCLGVLFPGLWFVDYLGWGGVVVVVVCVCVVGGGREEWWRRSDELGWTWERCAKCSMHAMLNPYLFIVGKILFLLLCSFALFSFSSGFLFPMLFSFTAHI
jgi:hypothetical protein